MESKQAWHRGCIVAQQICASTEAKDAQDVSLTLVEAFCYVFYSSLVFKVHQIKEISKGRHVRNYLHFTYCMKQGNLLVALLLHQLFPLISVRCELCDNVDKL